MRYHMYLDPTELTLLSGVPLSETFQRRSKTTVSSVDPWSFSLSAVIPPLPACIPPPLSDIPPRPPDRPTPPSYFDIPPEAETYANAQPRIETNEAANTICPDTRALNLLHDGLADQLEHNKLIEGFQHIVDTYPDPRKMIIPSIPLSPTVPTPTATFRRKRRVESLAESPVRIGPF